MNNTENIVPHDENNSYSIYLETVKNLPKCKLCGGNHTGTWCMANIESPYIIQNYENLID